METFPSELLLSEEEENKVGGREGRRGERPEIDPRVWEERDRKTE
jgi:hypothetical protein